MPEWFPESLNVILAIVGLIGLPAIWSVVARSRELTARRRVIRFQQKEALTVVMPTSAHEEGGAEGARYHRHTVNRPSLDALVNLTRLITTLGYKKPHRLTVSEEVLGTVHGDLAMVGGPIRNRVSLNFLELFNEAHPELRIDRERTEDGIWQISVGGELVASLEGKEGRAVSHDLALLVVWRNPFSGNVHQRRAMMFAGFTGMGNDAAVQYLDQKLPKGLLSYRRWRHAKGLPPLYSKKWPMFIAVLKVRFENQAVVSFEEKSFTPIREADS